MQKSLDGVCLMVRPLPPSDEVANLLEYVPESRSFQYEHHVASRSGANQRCASFLVVHCLRQRHPLYRHRRLLTV